MNVKVKEYSDAGTEPKEEKESGERWEKKGSTKAHTVNDTEVVAITRVKIRDKIRMQK